jgi:hypothetical protein
MGKLNGKTSGRLADDIFPDRHKKTCTNVAGAVVLTYDFSQ